MTVLDSLKSEQPPKELFHYTTQKGLLDIVTSESLWATNVSCLNDSSEFVLALQLANNIMTEIEKTGDYPPEKISLLRRELESIWRLHIFVSSFTENGDLLSQWRAYGDKSGGYSLGFIGTNLMKKANGQGFFLAKCIYDPQKQREVMTELIMEYLSKELYQLSISEAYKKDKNNVGFYTGTEFWKDLGTLAPILKDQGFKEEEEWRIISDGPIGASELLYRSGSSYIIPYFNFNLEDIKELLSSIIIGPTPHPSIASYSLWMFLAKKGLDSFVEIRPTNIPYRNW